jgi:uncharacterized membrane protein YhaH (DUF805 family)
VNWYREALRKYATFEGRARRKEYWFFALFNFLALVVLTVVDMAIGTFNEQAEIGLFGGIYLLAVLIPSIAVTVRRLHDTDRSGWWILLNFIPVVGSIVIMVFAVLDSQPGGNRFGPNPKGVIGAGTPMPIVERNREV